MRNHIKQLKQQQETPDAPDRLAPLIAVLPEVIREVGIQRKSRLNCWERESARTTGSQRKPQFRQDVIEFYGRMSNSGKSVRCQILDEYILSKWANDKIIAAHIWKASTRGKGLEEFGLQAEDVNSARNGLFLTKGIEEAFDRQQICFLYNILQSQPFGMIRNSMWRLRKNTWNRSWNQSLLLLIALRLQKDLISL